MREKVFSGVKIKAEGSFPTKKPCRYGRYE
jgi:hypothetical protein